MHINFKEKVTLRYFFLLLLVFLLNTASAQKIPIAAAVKFHFGDDLSWAQLSLNDQDWETRNLGNGFSANGLPGNIYAWYRIKVFIPSSIKQQVERGGGLKLSLGKIDDVDQTFFNGQLAGQTGSFLPAYQSKYNVDRLYVVSSQQILWDQENLIAVRLFSPDAGGVGMYLGDYYIGPVQFSDSITIHHTIAPTTGNGFTTMLEFDNQSAQGFKGTVTYTISSQTNKVLYTEKKLVQVEAAKGAKTKLLFKNFQSSKDNIVKISYQVQENNSSANFGNEQIYLANQQVQIPVLVSPKAVVKNKINTAFNAIPFQNLHLNGYLGNRFTKNLKERLLKVDEAGLIDGYWQRPGSHPWIGEHVGKYLEAACNTWKNTHDPALKKQMDRMMYKLIKSQLDDGYLGTYNPAQYWTSWDVWSHKYNLYGLLAYYETTGYQPALEACKRMGDLMCNTFGDQPGKKDIIKAGEHIGMAATSILDPMVELYKYTGDQKYLDFCYYILRAWEQPNGPKLISALNTTGKVTKVGNGKAYEMLSNFVGLTNLYRVTGDKQLLETVLIAWNDIVQNRLYVTGTTSSMEYFQEEGILPASIKDNMGEGCVTTTWIQFNQALLAITGDLKYAAQIEKSIYNHLLAAENPVNGCVSYYTPLMGAKPYSCSITCCTSSVPRGIAMIPYFTFGLLNSNPAVLMYEPAQYTELIQTSESKQIKLKLELKSNFPETGHVLIDVHPSQTARFKITLRVPEWSKGFIAKVGNDQYVYQNVGQYIEVNRLWKAGDKIDIQFEMPIIQVEGGKSYIGQIALQRGPQVLAFDESLNRSFLKNGVLNPSELLEITVNVHETKENLLPTSWIGNQAYLVNFKKRNGVSDNEQLVLVPYADASQQQGVVWVWMPLKPIQIHN